MDIDMNVNAFSSGLKSALVPFGANHVRLSFGHPLFASYKSYHNALISRNLLAKAAQLVNDIEDARAAPGIFQASFASAKSQGSLFEKLV